jgi:hypothetical protein
VEGLGSGLSKEAREELERKIKDMEEQSRRTRAQCLEALTEQSFAAIYDFFQTNVTMRDNVLNDQQLAELETIIMTACGNNVQKSYVVMFNVQVGVTTEGREA